MQPNASAFLTNVITNPPTAFPKVTVGGLPFEMRFTLSSSFALEQNSKIPAQELSQWIGAQVDKRFFASMLLTMTSSMLGNVVNGQWVPQPMDPAQFANQCTASEWQNIMGLYTEAMQKVAALVQQALQPAPPTVE